MWPVFLSTMPMMLALRETVRHQGGAAQKDCGDQKAQTNQKEGS
jgi:hypothetical protein